jgi:hypothetical protein
VSRVFGVVVGVIGLVALVVLAVVSLMVFGIIFRTIQFMLTL